MANLELVSNIQHYSEVTISCTAAYGCWNKNRNTFLGFTRRQCKTHFSATQWMIRLIDCRFL